ncbi:MULTISPECIES: hypothetical protein [Sphingomonas]|uniref:hypothetical protein n=1 Tax=Sphingomonas TaxID=13687 RepID=UPI000DEF88BF|nr:MULTISPECIES: hypothetical protein [Sphingomonas]
MQVTRSEYRANLAGLNTFFGAVLGFVLADIPAPTPLDFAQLLLFTAAIVIGILYVSASPQRWMYAALNLVLIWSLPRLLWRDGGHGSGRLQVTLAVWTGMAIFIEALWAWQQRRASRREPPAT